jgi:hypothetical protein
VKVPGCGWVRFRLSRRGKGAGLPAAKTFRVTFRNGQWHIAFAVIPDPIDAPGSGEVIGIDRGPLSDGLRTPASRGRRGQVRRRRPGRLVAAYNRSRSV